VGAERFIAANPAGTAIGWPDEFTRSRTATTYVVWSDSRYAGWMISARVAALKSVASSSAQYGTRWPVAVSISTIGASASSDMPMLVIGATCEAVRSTPGSTVRIG